MTTGSIDPGATPLPQSGPATVPDVELVGPSSTIRARSQLQIVWGRFIHHKVGLIASAVLLLMVLMAIFYPMISPFSATGVDPSVQNQAPGWPHIFGTGPLGEDIFSEVWYGARTSMLVGICAALAATFVGALLGALGGYFGGVIDAFVVLITDVFLAAPTLAVLLALAAAIGQLTLPMIIFIIALLAWMSVTRLVRAEFIALREREFVLAARAVGASPARLIIRHMLPSAISVIIVSATLLVATAIILEATLSFLGVGLDLLSNPSWGNLVNRSQDGALLGYWWGIVFPGLMIVLTCLCVSFLGDGLRDALDPHGMESKTTSMAVPALAAASAEPAAVVEEGRQEEARGAGSI